MKGQLVGYLGTCGTPYCGGVEGYFCVRCRHYTASCLCGCWGHAECGCTAKGEHQYLASAGERPMLEAELAKDIEEAP